MRLLAPLAFLGLATTASMPHAPLDQAAVVAIAPVASGFVEPTDVQFWPGRPDTFVVLEKGGDAAWATAAGDHGPWLHVDVLTRSEEGLLGLAFHPKFAENGRFYTNRVASVDGKDTTLVDEWSTDPKDPRGTPVLGRRILAQEQPYPNHDAGQLQFGPDGMLYVGFGDGGAADDPRGNGQDPGTWLGKMLRIDVDHALAGQGYAVPTDNPFVGKAGYRPEIWATGLRNPWRYSFAPDGRLVVADVGQNRWEEVDVVAAGANLGWDVREGRHCHEPAKGCATEGLVDPIFEYSHADGVAVTGGYVYTGSTIPALKDRYVLGDFGSGRLWAITLEGDALALGRFAIQPVAFGRDANGELYVADYGSGTIYRLIPP